jgi:hypothetical protein
MARSIRRPMIAERSSARAGPDGRAVYQQLIPSQGHGVAEREEAIEAAIQEAWRALVQHVGPPEEDADGRP